MSLGDETSAQQSGKHRDLACRDRLRGFPPAADRSVGRTPLYLRLAAAGRCDLSARHRARRCRPRAALRPSQPALAARPRFPGRLPAALRPPITPTPVLSPYSDVAAMLSPFRSVAPVGSQVVMLAGVRGGDGYLRTNRRLEWWLCPGSVGRFTAIGQNSFADFLVGDFTDPASSPPRLPSAARPAWPSGPAGRASLSMLLRGQGWVTVSSPVEGVSHVTLVAPERGPARRTAKSATIYWIDAQFGLPTPAIAPAGSKQSLTTTVWRQSNHCPRPGWIVRYEVACGPPAVFGPAGTPSIEVPTNEAGQASVEIFQKDPSPGTNQVRVQVFRPADSVQPAADGSRRQRAGHLDGPFAGNSPDGACHGGMIGETVTYRIEVSNPGDLPARDVVASEEVPDGLTFLQANPAPVVEGRRLQWRLGDLAPRQQQTIEATFRTTQPGVDRPLRRSHRRRRAALEPLCEHECPGRSARARLRTPPPVPGPTYRSAPPTVSAGTGGRRDLGPQGHARGPGNRRLQRDLRYRPDQSRNGAGNRHRHPRHFGDGLEHEQRSPITRTVKRPGPGQSAQVWRHLPRHPAGTTLSPCRSDGGRRCPRGQPIACVTAASGCQRHRAGSCDPAARNDEPSPRRHRPRWPCRWRSGSPVRQRRRSANRSSLRPRSPISASSRLPTWS